jgi:hypothetical protein
MVLEIKFGDIVEKYPFIKDCLMHNPCFKLESEVTWLTYHKMFDQTHYDSRHLYRTCCFVTADGQYRCAYHHQGCRQSSNLHFHEDISKMVKVSEFPSWIPVTIELPVIPTPEQNIINFFSLSNTSFLQCGGTAFREMAEGFWKKSQGMSFVDFQKWVATFHRHSISQKVKEVGVNILRKKLINLSGECVCIEIDSGTVVNKRFVAVCVGAPHLMSRDFILPSFLSNCNILNDKIILPNSEMSYENHMIKLNLPEILSTSN